MPPVASASPARNATMPKRRVFARPASSSSTTTVIGISKQQQAHQKQPSSPPSSPHKMRKNTKQLRSSSKKNSHKHATVAITERPRLSFFTKICMSVTISVIIVTFTSLFFLGLTHLVSDNREMDALSMPFLDNSYLMNGNGFRQSSSATYVINQYFNAEERNALTPRQTRYIEIMVGVVGESKKDLGRLFHDQSSPSFRAREWILYEDMYAYGVEDFDVKEEEAMMMQRFTMVLFYFAFDGLRWKENTGWPQGRVRGGDGVGHECNWFGVTCDLRKRVTMIWLRENNLVGTIPDAIKGLEELDTLVIPSNNIIGTIPLSLTSLDKLRQIDFHDNYMTGNIPEDLYNGETLEYLALNTNQFSGSISKSIRRLVRVQTLYLYGNMFTGTIPSEIGLMPSVSEIALEKNKLKGKIPSTIGNLRSLRWFSVHGNSMSGTIPREIGRMKNLATLYLYDNNFTGTVSSSICRLRDRASLKQFYADCRQPRSLVHCPCCTSCCAPPGGCFGPMSYTPSN